MENKVCFITGSGSGNGRGMALRLAELGYDIALHYSGRDPELASAVCARIREMGRRCELFCEDLSVSGAPERLFRQFADKFDSLDLFINNSGITRTCSMQKMTEEFFDKISSVNWRAACFCMREAGNFMRDHGNRGVIICIASNHHRMNWPDYSTYGTHKEALIRFIQYAAIEYAKYGIRVNSIAPGFIDPYDSPEEYPENFAKGKPEWQESIPLKRFVRSSEIADFANFIASPSAASLTGANIDLDGGAALLFGAPSIYGL